MSGGRLCVCAGEGALHAYIHIRIPTITYEHLQTLHTPTNTYEHVRPRTNTYAHLWTPLNTCTHIRYLRIIMIYEPLRTPIYTHIYAPYALLSTPTHSYAQLRTPTHINECLRTPIHRCAHLLKRTHTYKHLRAPTHIYTNTYEHSRTPKHTYACQRTPRHIYEHLRTNWHTYAHLLKNANTYTRQLHTHKDDSVYIYTVYTQYNDSVLLHDTKWNNKNIIHNTWILMTNSSILILLADFDFIGKRTFFEPIFFSPNCTVWGQIAFVKASDKNKRWRKT